MPSSSIHEADTDPGHEKLASACLAVYAALPRKAKPCVRSNGLSEWTVLAGFALISREVPSDVRVVSLGTGVKCLPGNRLTAHGDVLRDSHAEIIARRAFILWCYDELAKLRTSSAGSQYFQRPDVHTGDGQAGARLKSKWKLCVYVSTLPCGDASTYYLSETSGSNPCSPAHPDNFISDLPRLSTELVRGRAGYLHLGALRTKPARPDAPTTRSMSCSDKLAGWAVTGVQGALLARLLERPIYVEQYVFGEVQLNLRDKIRKECRRALYERLGDLLGLPIPYERVQPSIRFTDLEFSHSRTTILAERGNASDIVSAANSMSWIAGRGVEVTSNGTKQGSSAKDGSAPRKPGTVSRLSSRVLLAEFLAACPEGSEATYREVKQGSKAYQAAKAALRECPDAPFSAWLVNDAALQSFVSLAR